MNTQHFALLTLITFTLARSLLGQSVGPDVVVRDMRLFYADDEFFVKGVCYSPSPIAQDDTQAHVGYCSAHKYFVIGQGNATEQQSPCYYQDYFDGTSYVGGPPNGFLAVWQRDLPLLQSANVNTLRIYHAFPITSTNVANGGYDQSVQAANHIAFLDLAQSYNMKVIFPLFSDESYLETLSQEYMQLYIRNIIDEVGYHPALLMLQFGNELQFSANGAAYVDKVSGYITYAKNYQLTRWGRNVPITTALIDNPNYYNSLSSLPVDVFTTNAGYRGFTFTDLWSGNTAESFTGFYDLSCSAGKPILIGEMGVHENTPYFDVSSWFPQLWGDLLAHKTQGAIGGCIFEYQDEGWKGLTDGTMGMVIPQPTGPWAVGAFYLDTVTPKTTGAYNWTSIVDTLALNPFGSSGPATLSSVNNQYCPAGSPSTPLGVNNNVPSGGSIPTHSAPTTLAPTVAPTTVLPTTVLPSTVSPTTVSPSTVLPTTSPTTMMASTASPSTAQPTTMMPTSAPTTTPVATTASPTTRLPISTAAPTTLAVTTSAPTTRSGSTAAPTTNAVTTVIPTTSPVTTTAPTTTAVTTTMPTTASPTTSSVRTALPTTVPVLTTSVPSTAAPTTVVVTTAPAITTPNPTTRVTTTSTPTTVVPTTAVPSTPAVRTTTAPTAAPTSALPTTLVSTTVAPTVTANPTLLPTAMPTSSTASPTATSTPTVNPTLPATTTPTQQPTSVPTTITSTTAPTPAVTVMPTSTTHPQAKNGATCTNALSMIVAIVVVIASCM